MLARLQWLSAVLCAVAIALPASHNTYTDRYVNVWQLDDGPYFLWWLLPLAACGLGLVPRRPWVRSCAAALQCLLGLGVALVIWSLSSIGANLFFSEIAWGGRIATAAALAFAAFSAMLALVGLRAKDQGPSKPSSNLTMSSWFIARA